MIKEGIKNWASNWRILFIAILFVSIFYIFNTLICTEPGLVSEGKVNLSKINFQQDKAVRLDGQWEFYWDRLLTPEEFEAREVSQMDSYIKVPGSWNDIDAGAVIYPNRGVGTYRVHITYPSNLKDPALSIRSVVAAYKVYANGHLIGEVGKLSNNVSDFKGDFKPLIVALPKDITKLELIIQVGNRTYVKGGLRESLVFGSKHNLIQQEMLSSAIKLLFIGGIFLAGAFGLILYSMNRKYKALLFFGLFCLVTALRAGVLDYRILTMLSIKPSVQWGLVIEYFGEYHLIPLLILFLMSMYPLDYKKKIVYLILLPTLFFEVLLFVPSGVRASFNNLFFLILLLQLIYILCVQVVVVLRRRDNAILMLITISIYCSAIILDLLRYKGLVVIEFPRMFLYGNFILIMSMSYLQARQQVIYNQNLFLYNSSLIEADRLKDQIRATEMEFLQAQIKPHFLYNALGAIANVAKRDGEKGSELMLDLAIYLRNNLNFNGLEKMVSVEKELEFIDTYFHIEQARFGPKIQLRKEIEIPLGYKIPALMIQPLVENAIRHGISKKREGGTVCVRMKEIEQGICIEVEDDGIGIEDEKIAVLLNEDRAGRGLGLINTHQRLIRLYRRGLHITSKVGQGTCIQLIIARGRKDGQDWIGPHLEGKSGD